MSSCEYRSQADNPRTESVQKIAHFPPLFADHNNPNEQHIFNLWRRGSIISCECDKRKREILYYALFKLLLSLPKIYITAENPKSIKFFVSFTVECSTVAR
ncbi:hypothetical protein Ahy_A07g034510 isoform B [Arachis hypogaea]|uniref:Uncharacterized protein n=1 Tax=Arachis hypogaea TaxID=3818 RepID=A0A445CC55_ARAHY|nr:hypothetical protein Ahy_A07g034510 isoform B [Arachis hypogaea]